MLSIKEYIILALAIIFNAGANILLKIGMKNSATIDKVGFKTMFIKTLLNFYVWAGLTAFGTAFIFYSIVLAKMKLSIAYPIMTSAGFAIVTIASFYLFAETITTIKISGLIIIAIGIIMISNG